MNTLEQLVRQLEREVSALEKRSCAACAAAASTSAQPESERSAPEPASARSDTESVGDTAHTQAQVSLLKEQLERAEAQLQVCSILMICITLMVNNYKYLLIESYIMYRFSHLISYCNIYYRRELKKWRRYVKNPEQRI